MSGPFDDDDFVDPEAGALDQLGVRFTAALQAKDDGKIDVAEDELRTLISEEPRLGEPHLELARLLLDTERLAEAEDHAREAIEQFERSGTWIEAIPANIIRGLAHATLAEILRRKAEEDDVIFGDAAEFHALIAESKQHFEKAAEFDPSDEYASYHAFFLGASGHGGKVEFDDGLKDDDPVFHEPEN